MKKGVQHLKEEQIRLARKIIIKDDFEDIATIAGVDQTYKNNKIISFVVVCDYKTMNILETAEIERPITFPYIPTYLNYREAPAIVEVINQLSKRPDILLVDGHGISHPRKIGLASHVGLALDIPTIGVAKSLLCGEIKDGKLIYNNETRGQEMITKEHAKPIYISPGYRISLKTAVEIIKNTIKLPHKYPEPLYLAHRSAKKTVNKSDSS